MDRTLVLVHAFPLGARMWDGLRVPHGWQVLTPSLPGFDGVPLPPAGSTAIDDYAEAVLRTLDARGVGNFVAGGLSMGGYVAFALWRLAAPRIRGLVLADTRPGADGPTARAGRDAMSQLVRREGAAAVAGDMLPRLLGPTSHARRPDVVSRVRALTEAQSPEAIEAAILRMRDRPDATSALGGITVPTLVIVGEEDAITPPSESEAMHRAIQRSALVRLPEAGHLSSLERPDLFEGAIETFLGRV